MNEQLETLKFRMCGLFGAIINKAMPRISKKPCRMIYHHKQNNLNTWFQNPSNYLCIDRTDLYLSVFVILQCKQTNIQVYFYCKPMQTFFCDFRKICPRVQTKMDHKHVSDKRLFVGNSGILSVIVVCLCPRSAYVYLTFTKIQVYYSSYLVDPNGVGFFISNTFLLRGGNTALCLKNKSRK